MRLKRLVHVAQSEPSMNFKERRGLLLTQEGLTPPREEAW